MLVEEYAKNKSCSRHDVDEEMKKQGWTPKIMFEKAEDFFKSIGFEPMTQTFWEKR